MAGGQECNVRKAANVQFWPEVDFYGQNLSKPGFTTETLISPSARWLEVMLTEHFSSTSTKQPMGNSVVSFQCRHNESDASMSEGLIRRARFMKDKNEALFQYFSKSFCLFSLWLTSQNHRIIQLEESSREFSSNLLLKARSLMGSD